MITCDEIKAVIESEWPEIESRRRKPIGWSFWRTESKPVRIARVVQASLGATIKFKPSISALKYKRKLESEFEIPVENIQQVRELFRKEIDLYLKSKQ